MSAITGRKKAWVTCVQWQWARPFPRTGRGCTAFEPQSTTACRSTHEASDVPAPLSVVTRHASPRPKRICRAHSAQRAALAGQAVPGALTRVHKGAPGARPIMARIACQTMMNALLDDQGMEVAVEGERATRRRGDEAIAGSEIARPLAHSPTRPLVIPWQQRAFDQLLYRIVS